MDEKNKILISKGITPKTKHHDYSYLFKSMLESMEEYHQAKSKEEAEERYKKAMKYRDYAITNRKDPAVWTKKSIKIASGKEGER